MWTWSVFATCYKVNTVIRNSSVCSAIPWDYSLRLHDDNTMQSFYCTVTAIRNTLAIARLSPKDNALNPALVVSMHSG
jgi:hypothetical protein